MIYENMVKNYRILIKREKDGKIVADTKVLRYDSLRNSVIIDAGCLLCRKPCNVNVLIFGADKLYEFFGSLNVVIVENEVEVLLGKTREKEDRKRTRYNVSLNGFVKIIQIKQQDVVLRKPIVVVTINMSSNGILLRTGLGTFYVGSKFQILLEIDGKKMELECQVVRIQNSTPRTEEYGCKINATRMK